MLLLITVMCVIAEKKLQLNSASLRCRNFYHWWYFNWGGPGPLATPMFLKLVIFITKQKSSKTNLRVNDLMLKMLQKAMYLDSPDQAKSQNLTSKSKILNVFWT